MKPEGNSTSVRDSIIVTKEGIFEVFGKDKRPWKAHEVKVAPFAPNIGVELPWSEVGIHT